MRLSSIFEHSSSSPSSLASLIRACKSTLHLHQLHAHVIRKGSEQDHYLITELISKYASFLYSKRHYDNNLIAHITSIFDRVANPNSYLYNTLIKTHVEKNASLGECFRVLRRMKREANVGMDYFTFPLLFKACASGVAVREGMIVHGLAVKCVDEGDLFVGSSLIDMYGKFGEVGLARKVFDAMPVRNEVSWTAMMVGYLNCGCLSEAKHVFDKMPKRNEATWNAMIKGLVRFGELNSARKLFEAMPGKEKVAFTTLIDGYAKAGDMAMAQSLFDELVDKDLVSWSALISGYAQNGKPREAVKVFGEMCGMNVKPDEFIMVSLMSACSQLGSLDLAKCVDSYIQNGTFDLQRDHIAAALVDMNAKCGNMERANTLFESMPRRDLITYCSMIQGLCIHGHFDQAVSLFDRMLEEGLRPDYVAFTVILTACSHAGLSDHGTRYFELMVKKYSLNPSPDHYACMVNLLGKSGKLKAAYELIRFMPVEPHAGAWGALLGACRLYCDVELGEEVAHRLFELEPHSGGSYVLLSNIYAEADRWVDVSHLRDKMCEKGVHKVPGFSYVESACDS